MPRPGGETSVEKPHFRRLTQYPHQLDCQEARRDFSRSRTGHRFEGMRHISVTTEGLGKSLFIPWGDASTRDVSGVGCRRWGWMERLTGDSPGVAIGIIEERGHERVIPELLDVGGPFGLEFLVQDP